MNLRPAAIVLGVALACSAIGWWIVVEFVPAAAIDIDPAQLQARIAERFPQKNCTMMVACLTLVEPHVALAEGSQRIGLVANVTVSWGRREMPGTVAFSGSLRYVRDDGDFYLDDVRLDHFSLDGFSPAMVQVVKAYGPTALSRALEGHPIYTLKGRGESAGLIKLSMRDAQVVDGKVRVTFLRLGA